MNEAVSLIPPIPDKTERELAQLALDIETGKVVTSQHFSGLEDLMDTFLPLRLLTGTAMPDNLGLIYEYRSELKDGVVFTSFQMLNMNDFNRLNDKIRTARAAMRGALYLD